MLFGEGLRASNIWYGNAETVVWMQPSVPPEFVFPPELAQSYEESGWVCRQGLNRRFSRSVQPLPFICDP